jgi:hypothetical protein
VARRSTPRRSTPPALTVAVPVALYLVVLGLLQRHLERQRPARVTPAPGVALVLLALAGAATFLDLSLVVLLMGGLVAGLVAWHVAALQRA